MCQIHGRSPLFCILPPHILREIAKNGSDEQRDKALNALAIDATTRASRITYELMEKRSHQVLMAATPAKEQRTIYDAGDQVGLPGNTVRSEGEGPTGDLAVDEAYDGLGATWQFYLNAYQRNSIDDEGLHLDASVHYGNGYDNAFWNGQQMVFGDGDGDLFNRFTIAVDVIGHELTHGVTGHEAKLIYLGEPGALNESISDVFGSLVKQYSKKQTADQADWLIGEGLFTAKVKGYQGRDAVLRSMKDPGTGYDDPVLGKDPQPATMKEFVHTSNDNGGVHINSGIPNHAFYLAATKLGGNAWERAGRIWYETIRDPQLQSSAKFVDFALRTVVNAGHLYGSASAERDAVAEAWREVGVILPPHVSTIAAAPVKAPAGAGKAAGVDASTVPTR